MRKHPAVPQGLLLACGLGGRSWITGSPVRIGKTRFSGFAPGCPEPVGIASPTGGGKELSALCTVAAAGEERQWRPRRSWPAAHAGWGRANRGSFPRSCTQRFLQQSGDARGLRRRVLSVRRHSVTAAVEVPSRKITHAAYSRTAAGRRVVAAGADGAVQPGCGSRESHVRAVGGAGAEAGGPVVARGHGRPRGVEDADERVVLAARQSGR